MFDKDAREEETSASASPNILELQKRVLDLERRGRFFEMLIRSLPGVFYVFDQDQKFLSCNENMEKISGYSRDEFLHMTVDELFKGADLKRIRKAWTSISREMPSS